MTNSFFLLQFKVFLELRDDRAIPSHFPPSQASFLIFFKRRSSCITLPFLLILFFFGGRGRGGSSETTVFFHFTFFLHPKTFSLAFWNDWLLFLLLLFLFLVPLSHCVLSFSSLHLKPRRWDPEPTYVRFLMPSPLIASLFFQSYEFSNNFVLHLFSDLLELLCSSLLTLLSHFKLFFCLVKWFYSCFIFSLFFISLSPVILFFNSSLIFLFDLLSHLSSAFLFNPVKLPPCSSYVTIFSYHSVLHLLFDLLELP